MLDILVDAWAERLCSISWFRCCLHQRIARPANAEAKCTEWFWEDRFISPALLEESAMANRMADVDLNPIRAGISSGPQKVGVHLAETAHRAILASQAKCTRFIRESGLNAGSLCWQPGEPISKDLLFGLNG